MSSENWPPPLKEWVAKCLGQMTDANRGEAQSELKKVIADAYAAKTLWTTDWAGMQLESLAPKPPAVFASLKRKMNDQSLPTTKKAKKAAERVAREAAPFNPNDQSALNKRAARFQREHEIERQKINGTYSAPKPNPRPGSLFDRVQSRTNSPASHMMDVDDPEADPNVPNWDRFTIVGTSQEIFKNYLRLTSEPKPEQIRPYLVLEKTLQELKLRWKEKTSYDWICNQFKSLRQDLTVQRIKNPFTVQVYEIHARIALEMNDMVEYNQCQATLKTLYELGITGGHEEEFTAYRILMLLHGRNRSDMNLFVGQLTPKQKSHPAVQHALQVQRALSTGNYHNFFQLLDTAPNMGGYIMDHFRDRERLKTLIVMTKAYQKLPVSFIQSELLFEDARETLDFLSSHGATAFSNPNSPDEDKTLECKSCQASLTQSYQTNYSKVGIIGAI